MFDGDGNFLRQIVIDVPFDEKTAKMAIGDKPNLANYKETGGTFTPGAPWALCITPPPNQVLYASDAYPGRIYKLPRSMAKCSVCWASRANSSSSSDGSTRLRARPRTCVFVAEILNWRVQKLVLHPEKK